MAEPIKVNAKKVKRRWYTLLGYRINGEYKREIDAAVGVRLMQLKDRQQRGIESRVFLLRYRPRSLFEWENPISLIRTISGFTFARRNKYTGKIRIKI